MARIRTSMLIDGGGDTSKKTTTPIDPYYKRDPITGLSPAQVEAQNALKEAQATNEALGIKTSITSTPGSAGRIKVTSAGTQPPKSKVSGDYDGDGDVDADDIKAALEEFNAGIKADALAQKREAAQSAYDLLFSEFDRYGLGALVLPLQKYIQDGISAAEFTLRLRKEPAYQKRFAANDKRVSKGLRALSEAEYIQLEDAYQDVMRRYGMPSSYYAQEKDPITGIMLQPGFEKLIAGDVSAPELEDRVQTAYNRVINAAPQIKDTLSQYYGDQITNGDILAYVLDPENAINNIKRKVTAAEIGGAASRFGLGATRARAEELGTYGVTSEQAQDVYEAIGGGLERGRQLSAIYGGPAYTQTTAETELFKLPSATEARKQRTQLIKKEQATFGGSTGVTGGALARDRAGAI